jgi:hypothetical protein
MGRIIRLTEQDLARIVRRVINEKAGGTHSAMANLAVALSPYGFVKLNNGTTNLGPNGEYNGLSKGMDGNGADIYYSSSDMKIYLSVSVGMVEKVQKEYPISAPDYLVDDKQIIKDLGIYKTYKFKKTPNMG